MALELILTNKRLLRHPLWMMAIGFAAVTIAIFLSWRIFPGSSSLVLVAFTVIPLVPLMVKLLEHEETIHSHVKVRVDGPWPKIHSIEAVARSKVLVLYGFLFTGLIIGFLVWNIFLPAHVSQHIFNEQDAALYDFRGPGGFAIYQDHVSPTSCNVDIVKRFAPADFGGCLVVDFNKDDIAEYIMLQGDDYHSVVETGKYELEGDAYEAQTYQWYLFKHILSNNFIVLLFVFLTSFIYGAGALFILTWNASIIAYFFSETLRGTMGYITVLSTLFHGVPEIVGFLLASISGGVVSVAFIRHKFMDKAFRQVFRDSFVLFLISLAFLIIGAGLEVL